MAGELKWEVAETRGDGNERRARDSIIHMKRAVISLIFLAFPVAFGQDSPPAERVYRIGNGVSAPRVASTKEPEYS